MTNLEMLSFYFNKKEHYPISDEFIENYQQKDDGKDFSYITYAHETEHSIDPENHEPNQKWHLIESYFIYKLIKNNGDIDFGRGGFKSPELLLWMAEAAGVNECIVTDASAFAKKKIDEIRKNTPFSAYSAKSAEYMNKKIKEKYQKSLWSMTVEIIERSFDN